MKLSHVRRKTESIFHLKKVSSSSPLPLFGDVSRRRAENYFYSFRARKDVQQRLSEKKKKQWFDFSSYIIGRSSGLMRWRPEKAKTDFRKNSLRIVKRDEFLIFFSGIFHVKRWCLMTIFRRILIKFSAFGSFFLFLLIFLYSRGIRKRL